MSVSESVVPASVGFLLGGGLVGGLLAWALSRTNRYLDAYLDQKGKQLATSEDFAQLLDQQRGDYARGRGRQGFDQRRVMGAQERWKLKRDTYVALRETLLKLSRRNEEAPRLVAGLEEHPRDPGLTARFRSLAAELHPLSDQLYLHTMLAGLWLDDEATATLRQFAP